MITSIIWLAAYDAVHSSVYFGECTLNPELVLPCAYDTMMMQLYC